MKQFQRLNQVSRIILSVGHQRGVDSGATFFDIKEVNEALEIVGFAQSYLTELGIPVLVVPDLSLADTCDLINSMGDSYKDLAIEVHKDSAEPYNPLTMHRRVGLYAHPESVNALSIAGQMIESMKTEGAHPTSWVRPDTDSPRRRLAFIRRIKMLSFIYEAGFVQGHCYRNENQFYAKILVKSICDILGKPNYL
jgi:N-acetylmuramoyl-L-alanine amidase